MILTKKIISTFIDKSNQLNANYYKDININNIENNPLNITSLSQLFYHIYNDLNFFPLCSQCHKPLKFKSFLKGYEETCSKKCYFKIYPEQKTIHKQKTYQKYTLDEKDIEWFRLKKNIHYLDTTTLSYLSFTQTPTEYLYCFKHNITKQPLCSQCQLPVPFLSFEKGYQHYCSSKCAANAIETKEKIKETCLERYQEITPLNNKDIQEKIKQTNLEKYGDIHPMKTDSIKEKLKNSLMIKYGVENYFASLEKRKEYEQKRVDTIRTNCLIKYDKNWILMPLNINYNLQLRKETCLKRYGVEHYVWSDTYKEHSKEIVSKIRDTKKTNGTINSSQKEDTIFSILKKYYKIVHRNYSSKEYPFSCDFYIEDIDMYIEYQGYFTHGYGMYDKHTSLKQKQLDKWKEKALKSQFFQNAIEIWTKKDVLKRETAFKNNLNFLELFHFSTEENLIQQINQVLNGLTLNYSQETLKKELQFLKIKNGDINAIPKHNKIVKHFQQNVLFEKENELFKNNPIVRRKLIENRCYFLNKKENELTIRELLSGFKISGLYNGYSYFSSLWFKYFIETYQVTSVYDPTGGWGNRLLGSMNLDLYIYNDISKKVYDNIRSMITFCDFKHVVTYNKNMIDFIPKETFEAIFTCPPYDDLETYEIKTSTQDIIFKMFHIFKERNIKIMGIVLKEDMEHYLPYFNEKIEINKNVNHFKTKKLKEFLYIIK